jgi:hypothetical protein
MGKVTFEGKHVEICMVKRASIKVDAPFHHLITPTKGKEGDAI